MEEVEFFNNGRVIVTNARFRVGSNTYAMQGVTSVKRGETPANKIPAIIMAVIGLFMLLGAQLIATKFLGAVVIVAAIFIFRKLKSEYSVYLNSASGESQALQSKDLGYIDQVINALNQAIVHRG